MNSTYITLTALGELFGVSNRQVGRWLKDMGLRTEDGHPSRDAIKQGLVMETPLPHGGYFWTWHKDKICHDLDMMGYVRGGIPVIEQHDGWTLMRAVK